MNFRAALLLLFATLACALADDQVARAQQQLKDGGFYYGEITGEKNTETAAAIRRFQIRNGLQITGELNEETLKALASAPAATPNKSITTTAPVAPSAGQDRQAAPPVYSARPAPTNAGYFARTPYEGAPPEVQEDVIVRAQNKLAQRDLYRGTIDGVPSSAFEFSLRAYQSRVGLHATGRLDLETLAVLELLPGANRPIFVQPRRAFREPPVRGEWVRP